MVPPASITAASVGIGDVECQHEEEELNQQHLFLRIQQEAQDVMEKEPIMSNMLRNTILSPEIESFEQAVARTIARRLVSCWNSQTEPQLKLETSCFDFESLEQLFFQALQHPQAYEGEHLLSDAIKADAWAAYERDPACHTVVEVLLFFKGFAALVTHRVANFCWHEGQKFTSLFLQSQASVQFGVDIHPAATLGSGILLDHATGVVIGETATVGDGCTILHEVTLGGTGKQMGAFRHPQVGAHVLIGAGSKILGNVSVGNRAKIGAGSVVLGPVPAGATAVGAPAKIVGRVVETDPAGDPDTGLRNVSQLHRSESVIAMVKSNSTIGTASLTKATPSEAGSITTVDDDDQISTSSSSDPPYNCMCTFREYTKMSKEAPAGTITYCALRKLLTSAGCPPDKVGCIFFDLDLKNVGHVHVDAFCEHFAEVLHQHCPDIPSEKVKSLEEECLAHYVKKK